MKQTNATITLIGSGEFSESMGRVYRAILARAPAPPNAVFLDTPAGFELNASEIAARAVQYFAQRCGVALQIARFKHRTRARAQEIENALGLLRRADFIFAGPGSPSYAVRHWRQTPIWETVRDRFAGGAHLVFASAAAIAVGAAALPVYEIFKAGEDPFWLDGLDLFADLGMHLVIVPHWNNTEGGQFDTRFCFMGEGRFRELEAMLPQDAVILGIDEYTACLFDVAAGQCTVMGAGNVTLRRDGHEWVYATGESFSFDRLSRGAAARAWHPDETLVNPNTVRAQKAKQSLAEILWALERTDAPRAQRALFERAHAQMHELVEAGAHLHAPADEIARHLTQLARALDEASEPAVKRVLVDHVHDTLHELAGDRRETSDASPRDDISPYVEVLIAIRSQLRQAKQYALADEIRTRLRELGIVLENGHSGTVWRRG